MDRNISVGIIGTGRIGKIHAQNLLSSVPGVSIRALADPYVTDETQQWAASLGLPEISTEPGTILTDSAIDAVLICSSTDTHAHYTESAARAGKHVFCEKPLDTNVARIRRALDVINESGVKFQIGFNRRFDHNFRALHEAVVEGKIGEPHVIRVTSRDPDPPPIDYIRVSGGLFLDMMIHDFDMVRYLSGSEVKSVTAKGAALVDAAIGEAGDVDTAVVTLELENGALAVIDNSRRAAYGYDQRAEVFGSLGAISSSNDAPSTAVLSTRAGVCAEKPLYFFLERYMDSFRSELNSFVHAISANTSTAVGAVDAIRPVQIAVAAKRSLEDGRTVELDYGAYDA